MSSFVHALNLWSGPAAHFLWPMLWQSSLLIALLFGLDYATRRTVRPAVRYAFWLVLLLKLVLPPSLAVPTGVAWWLRPSSAPAAPRPVPVIVRYGTRAVPEFQPSSLASPVQPSPERLSLEGALFVVLGLGSLALVACMLIRWRAIARTVKRATPAPEWLSAACPHPVKEGLFSAPALPVAQASKPSPPCGQPYCCSDSVSPTSQSADALNHQAHPNFPAPAGWETCDTADLEVCATLRSKSAGVASLSLWERAGVRAFRCTLHSLCFPRIRITSERMSPAVCGLFRPVILLPSVLADQLPRAQLRAVLLHEIIHLRRSDVWVNCVQALLQAAYWWHPLLWLANARIRRLREEAVDDAVMLTLGEEAETYAPTLLEVAKLAVRRPLASLGLVGILEPRTSLQRRIERLLEFRPRKRAGMTFAAAICILAFSALAVPMGQAPLHADNSGRVISPIRELAYNQAQDAATAPPENTGSSTSAASSPVSAWTNSYGHTNLISTVPLPRAISNAAALPFFSSHTRQAIMSKLQKIHLDSFSSAGLPLRDVLRNLSEESKKLDPEINFIYQAQALPPGAGSIDPATGLPVPEAPATSDVDVGSIPIRIEKPLPKISMLDALDAIRLTADRPIAFDIEDYGVVFRVKGDEGPPLYTHHFKVDPNTVRHRLQAAIGGNGSLQQMFADYMTSLGIDFHQPGRVVFVNEHEGSILVRSTLSELGTIEQAVATLSIAPPADPCDWWADNRLSLGAPTT